MRLGGHISVAGGKFKALESGLELGCESIQIFARNVRSWTSKSLSKEDIHDFCAKREELKNSIWPVITHNSYLVNLAGTEQEKLEKSHNAMLDELIKADQLHVEYLNMHPGNKGEDLTEEQALDRISNQINQLLEETKGSKVTLLLETTAGQGNDIGYKFGHLKQIIDKIEMKNRIGVCFDTCHAFAAGYDFTTQKNYDDVIKKFDQIVGLNYLKAFHLNDSEKELGSRADRHDHIGQGKIGKESFGFFVNDERFKDIPGILETPEAEDKYEMNLKTLKSLIKKK